MRLRRSILWSAFDKYSSQLITLVTVAVMSRLLTPAEVGVYFVANAFIMVADSFRNLGAGVYIVQAPVLSRPLLQSAFTVTLILSVALAAGIFCVADVIARFYDDAEIAALLRVAVIAFLAYPFATPLTALLQREMAFGTLAKVNILTAFTTALVTIGLASAGMGPISYAWGFVAGSVAMAVAAMLLRRDVWIFRLCLGEIRALVSFGTISAGITIVNTLYELVPRLAFGRLLGLEAVGLYSRAILICQLPDKSVLLALQPVVLPAMTAHARNGGDVKAAYIRALAMMSGVLWPALLMVVLLADPIITLLLGPQWEALRPLVRMIALGYMALAPAFLTFPLLVSVGRIRDSLVASLIGLPPSIAILLLAASVNLTAVAASTLVVAPLQMAVAFWFVRRAIGVGWHDLAAAAQGSVALLLGAAVAPCAIILASPGGLDLGWWQTAMALAGAALGWLATLAVVEHPLKDEMVMVRDAVMHFAVPARRERS